MEASPEKPVDEVTQSSTPEEGIDAEGKQDKEMDPDVGDSDVKEQDRWLPIANVARIMKSALPENAKIAKEAKECMQECVSEFISFITSEASEKCQQEKRKTVNGEDILFAMTSLGFENYGEALKIYLTRYRETFNNQSKGGAGGGGNGGVGGVGGAVGATGTGGIMMDGSELEVGDHTTTDFAYAHHGNGTAPGEY